VSRGHWAATQALSVPGVLDAGWTLADLIQASVAKGGNGDDATGGARQKSGALKQELLGLLRKIEEQQFAWPFREPVDPNEVPDYLDVITNPIDLKTMASRIRQDNYYKSKQMLFADLILMVNNCKLYNEDGSTYIQCAVALEKYARTLFHDVIPTMPAMASS
jgi:histone acetyltransferase